ncbi:MAG: sigma-70 family RNA polymerase sigma factor [Bacillota bacterium]|nr:sigma-70 family RNA polymerase sigma factor [Bacillota bacterium]
MTEENQKRDLYLVQRARLGDRLAQEELVRKYTPLVRHIVRNYYARFLEFDDLMQEGLIGLLHAIREYDGERYAVKFSSFAYICVIRKVYNVIKHTNGTKHRVLNDAVSLFNFVNLDETRIVLDVVASEDAEVDPEKVVEEEFISARVEQVLRAHLSVLEYTVIRMLLAGYSYADMERELGVSAKVIDNARTRVRLKLKRILQKYGSLLSPKVPDKTRQRKDLYYRFPTPLPSVAALDL